MIMKFGKAFFQLVKIIIFPKITRLHPQGKGGPFGAPVWKTFKSLRSETSVRRQMDRIVFKSTKNVIL